MPTIDPKLQLLVRPYFKADDHIRADAFLIRDLGITGSDYLALISDVEREFDVDLTKFLIGPEGKSISPGCIPKLLGFPDVPVFRDVSICEMQEFLNELR
jgi:hypothetical protein